VRRNRPGKWRSWRETFGKRHRIFCRTIIPNEFGAGGAGLRGIVSENAVVGGGEESVDQDAGVKARRYVRGEEYKHGERGRTILGGTSARWTVDEKSRMGDISP
jgi:hypothetical protein